MICLIDRFARAVAGNNIDALLIQFYGQGATCYTSYQSLFVAANASNSCPAYNGTSLGEIISYGVPSSKAVVGKITLPTDSNSGYVAPSDLHAWFVTAASALNWTSGIGAYMS
jgi:hypothetical protein